MSTPYRFPSSFKYKEWWKNSGPSCRLNIWWGMNFSLKVFHWDYSGPLHPGDLCWKQVSLHVYGFPYFARSQCFVFQGMVELYLGVFQGKTTSNSRHYCVRIDVVSVLCHAVPLGNILSITAKSVWVHPHQSLTDHIRTLLDLHELISPSHLSTLEFIYNTVFVIDSLQVFSYSCL